MIILSTIHFRIRSALKQPKENKDKTAPEPIPESPQISKRAQFKDISDNLHICSHKINIDFFLDINGSKTETHRKYLQVLHKTIYKVDSIVMIIKYKPGNDGEEIIESNIIRVAVKAKNRLMNYTEAIPKYLWQL